MSTTPAAKTTKARKTTPRHQWTHGGGEVLILKCVEADGTSHGGFQWPMAVGVEVSAPDWSPVAACGGGLHGWPWGFAIGDGKEPDWSGRWLVFGAVPDDVVDLGGKCKAARGTVRFIGDWAAATAFVLAGQMAWVAHAAHGAASATGESGAASATGWRGAASATGGIGAASATGERGAASATGKSGAASATGGSGAASATGDSSAAVVTGMNGRARSGPFGCVALAWWNRTAQRSEMRCAVVGVGDGSDGTLKAHTWYQLDDGGRFVEIPA